MTTRKSGKSLAFAPLLAKLPAVYETGKILYSMMAEMPQTDTHSVAISSADQAKVPHAQTVYEDLAARFPGRATKRAKGS